MTLINITVFLLGMTYRIVYNTIMVSYVLKKVITELPCTKGYRSPITLVTIAVTSSYF